MLFRREAEFGLFTPVAREQVSVLVRALGNVVQRQVRDRGERIVQLRPRLGAALPRPPVAWISGWPPRPSTPWRDPRRRWPWPCRSPWTRHCAGSAPPATGSTMLRRSSSSAMIAAACGSRPRLASPASKASGFSRIHLGSNTVVAPECPSESVNAAASRVAVDEERPDPCRRLCHSYKTRAPRRPAGSQASCRTRGNRAQRQAPSVSPPARRPRLRRACASRGRPRGSRFRKAGSSAARGRSG